MKRQAKLILSFRIFIVMFFFFLPSWYFMTIAHAVIAQPDSPGPTISNLHVNTDLITMGDALIYGEYNLPYASSTPTTPASSTFIFRLIDTDNTTELGSITPYVFVNYGYGYGAFSIYLPILMWNQPYILRISENPIQFAHPVDYDYVMSVSMFSTLTDQASNQAELAANILVIAGDLETQWGSTHTLIQPNSGSYVLAAPEGELYFAGAISNIASLAPDLFLIQQYQPDVTSTNWTRTQFNSYEARNDTNWIGGAENATATQFGITPQMIMGILIILPLCIGAIILSSKKYQRIEPGLIASAVILTMGGIMGWLPTAIFASINQSMGIYISYLFFYARS